MQAHTLVVIVKLRWWVVPYINTLAFMCATMGTEPDRGKVSSFIAKHGLRIIIK